MLSCLCQSAGALKDYDLFNKNLSLRRETADQLEQIRSPVRDRKITTEEEMILSTLRTSA